MTFTMMESMLHPKHLHDFYSHEGPAHLKMLQVKQYALIEHLETASGLANAREAKANSTCPSLSAFFMLNLIDEVL